MEEGEGGMIWENGIETCIVSYKKQIESRFNAGYRILGAGAPERWDGERGGRGFRIGNSCTHMADSC